MKRYIPKHPLINGFLYGISATLLQSSSILLCGVVYLSGYENPYLETYVLFSSLMVTLMTLKCVHNTCYGIIGRNIAHNKFYIQICPHYKKLHDDMPVLENIKCIYEYPLSSLGFIETLDQKYPQNKPNK